MKDVNLFFFVNQQYFFAVQSDLISYTKCHDETELEISIWWKELAAYVRKYRKIMTITMKSHK